MFFHSFGLTFDLDLSLNVIEGPKNSQNLFFYLSILLSLQVTLHAVLRHNTARRRPDSVFDLCFKFYPIVIV